MGERIIFFDGVCNLCNHFVDYVIRHDKEGRFKFSPLQGETAKAKLPQELREALESMAYLEDGHLYKGADAAFRIASSLNGAISVGGQLGRFLPGFLKIAVYNLVAQNRYRIFGKRETCRVPSPDERERFLP